jgi:hypothetical protein
VRIKTYEPGGHNRYGDYGPEQDEVDVSGSLESVVVTAFGWAFAAAIGLGDLDEAHPEVK